MYLQNKYTRWYYNIIQRAQSRTPLVTYTEKHHVIPQSLGGSNDALNIVNLTAKEHFVCHLLLVKMTEGLARRSMAYASWKMTHIDGRPRHKPSARIYSLLRKQLSESYKGIPKAYKHWLGKTHTEESKKKQSIAKQGKLNPNYGVKQKEEWNKKKSESQKGKQKPTYTCSVCNKKVGGKSNLYRWHEQNCSLNRV